jgi:ribosomal protein S18 acetylase RimI-like enzyme
VGLTVFAFNERAIRAYEKAGFRVEGRLREAVRRDGRFWDEIAMGILRGEWLARSPGRDVPAMEIASTVGGGQGHAHAERAS